MSCLMSLMFRTQPSNQKRRLLGFVLSNCTWKGGELTATYRQPFDFVEKNVLGFSQRKRSGEPETAISEIWLPDLGSNQGPND